MSALLNSITTYLPQHPGLLPKWLFLISTFAILNSVQSYLTINFTSRLYSEDPALPPNAPKPDKPRVALAPFSTSTPLQSRTFGTWTLVQSVARFYAAYNIANKQFYELAFATVWIAFGHYMAEWLVFKTVKWGAPLAWPSTISSITIIWMILQKDYYVKA